MTTQIMTGNELIIQGGLEAGFSLYTGYPGSPLADYFNILNYKKSEMQILYIEHTYNTTLIIQDYRIYII